MLGFCAPQKKHSKWPFCGLFIVRIGNAEEWKKLFVALKGHPNIQTLEFSDILILTITFY